MNSSILTAIESLCDDIATNTNGVIITAIICATLIALVLISNKKK